MSARSSLLLAGLLLSLASPAPAQEPVAPSPHAAILQAVQTGLQDAVAPADMLGTLPADPRQLLPGLVHASAHAGDTRTAMYVARIWHQVPLADPQRAAILVEHLDNADVEFARTLRGLLAALEGRQGQRRADFSIYRELIEGPVRDAAPLPESLVDYLFEVDAGQAVLLMMRAHATRQPDRIKQILWAEHIISAHLWQREHGFTEQARSGRPSVDAEVERLAADDAWWARRYATEIRARLAL